MTFDARKAAQEVIRISRTQIKLEWRPGQHVMTPEWNMQGYIADALQEAYDAGFRDGAVTRGNPMGDWDLRSAFAEDREVRRRQRARWLCTDCNEVHLLWPTEKRCPVCGGGRLVKSKQQQQD